MFCSIGDPNVELFFSIVDYRNNYFSSNNVRKVKEFFNGFHTSEQLIKWMKERPKGISNINEVDGSKEIIVVIPTGDADGKYARECRENIFEGLHIIFVESGGKDDFYFNYAHNCNIGIRKALSYKPKWIILSNDDMYKIDNVDNLRTQLAKLSPLDYGLIFSRPGLYHSIENSIVEVNNLYYLFSKLSSLLKRNNKETIFNLMKKYNCKYITLSRKKIKDVLISSFLGRIRMFYTLTSSFCIFSGVNILETNGDIFDETYINGVEDWDISIIFKCKPFKFTSIDYSIGDFIGETLGNSLVRSLRDVGNLLYFSNKIGSGQLKLFCSLANV